MNPAFTTVLPGTRLRSEAKAIRVPVALMAGKELPELPIDPPVVLVIWVNRPDVVSRRNSSALPSALPGLGVRFAVEKKAIRVPFPLMAGKKLPVPVGVFVIWVRLKGWAVTGVGANVTAPPASRNPIHDCRIHRFFMRFFMDHLSSAGALPAIYGPVRPNREAQ